jgi:DNA-directed RNA polymerase subunit L
MKESSNRFYSSKFAKTKPPIINSYRTFDIKKVGKTTVCDYEWDKPVIDNSFATIIAEQKLETKTKAEEAATKKKALEEAKKPTN